MPSSRDVFGLNNRKSGVNRHLQFCPFQKTRKCAVCGCFRVMNWFGYGLLVGSDSIYVMIELGHQKYCEMVGT